MRVTFLALAAALVVVETSFAQVASGPVAAPHPVPSGGATAHAGGAGQGAAGPAETGAQRAYRQRYVADTLKKESALLQDLVRTPEVHKASSAHWRRAYRALRIRELAEDDKEPGTVARVDAFLRKIDGHYFAYLAELAPTLPKIPAAPAVTAPAPQASVALGSALAIAATPAAGVTADEYYCAVYEPHAGWNNYDPKAKRYGGAGSCTIGASDPRWAKFQPGRAWVSVHTLTHAKSPKGVSYDQWSHARHVPITLTGAATTTVTGAPVQAATAAAAPGGAK